MHGADSFKGTTEYSKGLLISVIRRYQHSLDSNQFFSHIIVNIQMLLRSRILKTPMRSRYRLILGGKVAGTCRQPLSPKYGRGKRKSGAILLLPSCTFIEGCKVNFIYGQIAYRIFHQIQFRNSGMKCIMYSLQLYTFMG
jgi:hypothetical protein